LRKLARAQIVRWRRWLFEAAKAFVAYDADDREFRGSRVTVSKARRRTSETPAEQRSGESASERFIHDRDARCVERIALAEGSSVEQLDVERFEVTRADDAQFNLPPFFFSGHVAHQRQALAPVGFERMVVRHGDAARAGPSPNRIEDRLLGSRDRQWIWRRRVWESDAGNQHVIDRKTGVLTFDRLQRLGQQRGNC